MNDRDLNLIVDLIESQLSATEAETALTRIMADPELSSAYAEQLAIRTSLAELPLASMTVTERDALNSALVSQLRLESETALVPVVPRRKARWVPVVGVATAAVAVTAIFVMPGLSGSDDSSAETTVVVASAAEQAPQDSATDDGAAEFGAPEEDALSTQAPATVVDLEGADLVEVLDATAGESSPEAVQDRLNSLGYTDSAFVDLDVLAECISRVSGQLPPNATDMVLFGVDGSGPTPIAHIGIVFDGGIEAALSIDLETCGVVSSSN
jgi:hypothetical protein